MCVFLPMVFLPTGGRFAVFMTNIGLTVVVVMAASLAVALTVVPMVAARLLGGERTTRAARGPASQPPTPARSASMLRHAWLRLRGRARACGLLAPLPTHRALVSDPLLRAPVTIVVDTPSSYSVEQKRASSTGVRQPGPAPLGARDRRHHPHLPPAVPDARAAGRTATGLDIYLVDEEQAQLDTAAIRDRIEALLPVRAGVTFTMSRSQRGHTGSGSSIEVQLRGDRFEILELLAAQAVAALEALPAIRDADSSLESGDVEVLVRPDRDARSPPGFRPAVRKRVLALVIPCRHLLRVGDRELAL